MESEEHALAADSYGFPAEMLIKLREQIHSSSDLTVVMQVEVRRILINV